jgi:proteasome assembly chaperone (PAC2) family protein
MPHDSLSILNTPSMPGSTLLLALTGWMDGGDVSTGTVKRLMEDRDLMAVGRVRPGGFYIDNFPGSMEISALFRPTVHYEGGLVTAFDLPRNDFYADPPSNIAFFIGKEPNVNWVGFADCIFDAIKLMGCTRIIFMGSFGGTVPHTREPRLFGSVSERKLLPLLKEHGLRPSDYEGPASFASYLLWRAYREGVEMLSIAAEIPGYLQGLNPLSIEAVTRRLGRILGLKVDLSKLRVASNEWEVQVTDAVQKDDDLAKTVRKLEEEYDNELIEQPES